MSDSLLIRELSQDVTVARALAAFQNEPFLILFDSAGTVRESDCRFSILTADPVDVCRLDEVVYGEDPFARLRDWQARLPMVDDGVGFCGGIAGLMSYELGHAFERLPRIARGPFEVPALIAGLFDWAIVWDHLHRTVRLYAIRLSGHPRVGEQRLEWVHRRLQHHTSIPSDKAPVRLSNFQQHEAALPAGYALPDHPHVVSNFDEQTYTRAVQRVIDYISAGDIFQANLSQQLFAPWSDSAVKLYERVRAENPAPFCGLLQVEDFSVVSASPERFLRLKPGRLVETRPIKGTRRRHRSPIADLFTGNELAASEKDRAENIMIVDLLRNDISRVCQPGSVKVTGVCEIEVFETVQHLVSTVVGQLHGDVDVWDLCRATIPGGSITGAPKIRAMQIISELEQVQRGAYCGNLFHLGPNECFDSSILIRTFTLKDGAVQFPAGGGIVADSDPLDEYKETLHKAAAMLRTLGH